MTPEEREITDRIRSIEDRLERFPVRSVELLQPKPNDVLLITLPRDMSEGQRARIAEAFHRACDGIPGVRVAVLRDDMKVQVVRGEELPAQATVPVAPPSLDMGTHRI